MTAKQWLSRGYYLKQEKAQLERLRNELYERLTNVTQSLDGIPGGTKDPHKFDALIALNTEISQREAALDRIRLEIFHAIQELQDNRHRVVLTSRYLECMTWQNIAEKMSYDIRHVQRIHGMALVAIEPIIKRGGEE